MPYFTESTVRARASKATITLRKTASQILLEDRASASDRFDVFLSHSSAEPKELLLGVKGLLEDVGLNVYVDRYSDPQLSPEKVTPETAEIIRARMRQSSSLLYLYSRFSTTSRWMPWELGYFDGLKGRVGVFPVTQNQEDSFKREEYLGLYPHVDSTGVSTWINSRTSFGAAKLEDWISGRRSV